MVITKWLASLSDGTTVVEGLSPYEVIKGEDSPWLRLIAYIEAHPGVLNKLTGKLEHIHIAGLRIQVKKDKEGRYYLPGYRVSELIKKHSNKNKN